MRVLKEVQVGKKTEQAGDRDELHGAYMYNTTSTVQRKVSAGRGTRDVCNFDRERKQLSTRSTRQEGPG